MLSKLTIIIAINGFVIIVKISVIVLIDLNRNFRVWQGLILLYLHYLMIETLTSGFPRVRCVIVEKRLIAF